MKTNYTPITFLFSIVLLMAACTGETKDSELLQDESDSVELFAADSTFLDTSGIKVPAADSVKLSAPDSLENPPKPDTLELVERSPYFGIKSGKILYDVAIDSEEMNFMMQAMMPKEAVTWFKDNKTCMVMKGGGGMMDIRVLNNPDKGVFANLFAGMGQKMAIMMDPESGFGSPNGKVRVTGKTKKIAGVVCKEAVIRGDSGTVSKVYFTEEFGSSQGYGSLAKSGVRGMMMEYRVDMRGMKMVLRAKEVIVDEPDPALFLIPDGYTIKKREELGNGG